MSAPDAASQEVYAPPRLSVAPRPTARRAMRTRAFAALLQAGLASTLHRVQRGEGALLAINASLIAYAGAAPGLAMAQAVVSLLTIGLMYAFNDLYDAPSDWNNPKKDRRVIAAYVEHQRVAAFSILVLHLATVALALGLLGGRAAGAVAAVMVVNVVYSTVLKGVPVLDVVWCGLWGALYAAIVGAPLSLLLLVGVMTGVCHLFQALDDRVPDAANGIHTTAVRSGSLSYVVLLGLSLLLVALLLEPLGALVAVSAFTPLLLAALIPNPGTGWLLTKAYFGALWLYLVAPAVLG